MNKEKFKKISIAFLQALKMFCCATGMAVLVATPLALIIGTLFYLIENRWIVCGILGVVVIVGWTHYIYRMDNPK